jgi:hypothetical protein
MGSAFCGEQTSELSIARMACDFLELVQGAFPTKKGGFTPS